MAEFWFTGTVRNTPFLKLDRTTPSSRPGKRRPAAAASDGGKGVAYVDAFILRPTWAPERICFPFPLISVKINCIIIGRDSAVWIY